MIQYLIHALDHVDAGAFERRMAARPAHFEGAKKLKTNGNFIIGSAILDQEGKMIGSNMIVQFETEEAFQEYFKSEPYVSEGVWGDIKVYKTKVAQVP
ncbi:MAG: YciI family protein [Saprospiraceae bacterium]